MDIMNINLNLLKSFWAVYRTGGINKGAKSLGLATPVVAYNVKQLERQLDRKLFTMHKHGADPTGDASVLFPLVDNAFESLLKYNEQCDTVRTGTIRVGLTTMHASFHLTGFIKMFRAKYPDIELKFFHHHSHDYVTMLENNEIDVAIHLSLRPPTQQMHNFVLQRHPMVFFANKKFAKEHSIENGLTLEQLTKLPLIIFGFMKTKSVLEILQNHYQTKFNHIEAITTHSAYDMAMNGHGICYFFDEYLDAQNNDQIVKITLTDAPPPPTRPYDCAYHKKPTTLVSLFVRELKEFYLATQK